jgi:L-alanine-DL-glutamate epimerase-like enolase superfamily enzyme
MKIHTLQIEHLQIPMRIRFAQSNNATQVSSTILVKITTEKGTEGYGETCPRPYVTGESIESVFKDLGGLEASLKDRPFQSREEIESLVCEELPGKIGLAAICGLELAMLDAWSREQGKSVAEALGGRYKPHFQYSGVIPFGNLQKILPLLQQFQFEDIKIKVSNELESNLERVRAIKGMYDRQVSVRVDVNAGWDYEEARWQIPELIALGVTTIEQPLPAAKDADMQKLTEEFGEKVAIMADESICSYEQGKKLAAERACNTFNLKISKNGGILNTLRLARLAETEGLSCQLGAHFGETGLLTAAGLVLASLAPNIHIQEGGLGPLLLESDICSPSLHIDQKARINGKILDQKPGSGLTVLPDKVAQFRSS